MKSRALSVEKVVFRRGDKLVLDRVSLSVKESSIVGVLGARGTGKTTLFDIVCGLHAQETGRVSGPPRDRIAYLTQAVTVPDALRLGEMARLVYGLSVAPKRPENTAFDGSRPKALEKFKRLWDRRANNCSAGEKRWFVLMVILSLDADLYLLDEPTMGIDPEYRGHMWDALANLKARGKSVLFSTRLATDVERHSDRFYFLKNGALHHFANTAP